MLKIEQKTTALIIIDLQEGILEPQLTPFAAEKIIEHAAKLGRAFAQAGSPVVVTTTDFASGYADAPRGLADTPWALPNDGLPASFANLVPEIEGLPATTRLVKRQMSAFFGTELDLQLRRRGCETVVICGVATNFGVEATARQAFDLNYNLVIASDACSSIALGLHEFSMTRILPRIARVRLTSELIGTI